MNRFDVYSVMPNMTPREIQARKAELIRAAEGARATARRERTPEARDAAVAASAELSAFVTEYDPPKRGNYASRAGKRQAAEIAAERARRTR